MSELTTLVCPVCGIEYSVPIKFIEWKCNLPENDDRRGWHCPNGDRLIPTNSRMDDLRRQNERLTQMIAQRDDELDSERRRTAAAKGEVTKIKKRISCGVCPCCNRTFQNLASHMKTKHPKEVWLKEIG